MFSLARQSIKSPLFRSSFSITHTFGRTMTFASTFDVKNPSIQLNETELKISKLLKDFTSKYNSEHDGEDLELRITGGWVRDKLLGDESNDLDIAINKLSGEEFAETLREFLVENFETYQLSPRSIHKIEKNPEKSKHLETATTKLYDLDVDFVNLRSEEYTENSRIPIIKYGTPEEDALRRDATLNALFYNIQKDKVEDFTKRGLQDLKSGVLRTPLEPLKTFLDDPLRVLRLIRFASRFNFSIDTETFESMRQPSIKEALHHKISRERVGVEVEKTLEGKNPIYGLELLGEAGIMDTIFNFGPLQSKVLELNKEEHIFEKFSEVETTTKHALEVIKNFNEETKLNAVFEKVLANKVLRKYFWLAIVLRPWGDEKLAVAKQQIHATKIIIKDGVKLSKLDADTVTQLVSLTAEFDRILLKLPEYRRSEVGLLLKQYGSYLDLAITFNFFNSVINTNNVSNVIKQYESFYDIIHKENLQDSYLLKPIVDGKTLIKKLNAKPGPWMSKVNEQILVWQLDNPEKTQDDCIEYVASILNSQ